MTNIRRAILAILIAVVTSLGFGVGLASAHHNTVTGVATCQPNGTYSVAWNIQNSESDKTETASWSVSNPSQSGSLAIGKGATGHVSTTGHTASAGVQMSVHGVWSNGVTNDATSSKVKPSSQCQTQHQPVTLCHNGHPITIDDDAVVKQGHDGHAGDIIPAFDYFGDDHQLHHYAGKNLDKIGLLNTGCQPQPDDKVVTSEWSDGEYACGDTTVTQTRTVTTTPYVWNGQAWVEGQSTTVTETRVRELSEEEQIPCDTVPPTSEPPTTQPPTTEPPTTQPPVTEPPATTVPEATTTTATVPVVVVVDTTVPPKLPATGNGSTGIFVLACAITLIGGTLLIVRRKFRNA